MVILKPSSVLEMTRGAVIGHRMLAHRMLAHRMLAHRMLAHRTLAFSGCIASVFFKCVFALLLISTANAQLPDELSAELVLQKTSFGAKDTVSLEVIYTNQSASPLRFLRWDTAIGGRIDSDILSVVFNGRELPYTGRHFKRAPATEADYISLAPGAKLSVVVDINDAYPVQFKGAYAVAYRGSNLSAKEAPQSFFLRADRPVVFQKQSEIFTSCDASQQSQIMTALSAAEQLADTARQDLMATPEGDRVLAPRYAEWFGAYTQARWDTIQANFNSIYDATANKRIGFDCSCTDSFFAFVYSNDAYNMTLCSAFWSAPTTGTDSKAGTIIHELSHFTVVAGTDDSVYGQFAARMLADTNPESAINNADSHEYFAENTPFLSMPAPEPEPNSPTPNFLESIFHLLFGDD